MSAIRYYGETGSPLADIRLGTVMALCVVVALLLGAASGPGGALNPYRVEVTAIVWVSGPNLWGQGAGFDPEPGEHFVLTLNVTNFSPSPVDFTTASVASPFSLTAVHLPTIPTGRVGNLTVNVTAPDASFSGPLVVTLG